MWQTGLQLVLLSTTLENTSTPKEMRTSTSVQVFWMQATDTDFDLFQKRKDNRKLIESLRVLEIEAQWLCGQSNINVALQMCPGGWSWSCCHWALDMHLNYGHKWPQTLGTVAGIAGLLLWELDLIEMASTAREAPSGSLLPSISGPVVKDQNRWIWLVELRSHVHTLAARRTRKSELRAFFSFHDDIFLCFPPKPIGR